ncbi:MAG: [FeFe] hydrogenase H-cluster maturation GTPase HydF [Clostridiales bacterium]|nr:[FeFe] hydrogenase H-cluster maturation GTPase HydF [Clostridiales bacterium]
MSLNKTPSSDRVHIGIFGRRNAGKSSVINAITDQSVAIVSEFKGTTTDPVYKSMEVLPLGPIVLIDTPGIDDEGELGELRIKKTIQVLNKTDIAILVVDCTIGISEMENTLIKKFEDKEIPYIIVMNKSDLLKTEKNINYFYVSAKSGDGINELKELISKKSPENQNKFPIIRDLIKPSDFIILVTPIDSAAPKGRLILPQQQTIRDILDGDAVSVVIKENEIKKTLKSLGKKPKMIVCDSQVFKKVANDTPNDILLTSFSILFARHKGNLEKLVNGISMIDKLNEGDSVLISEGCTHHRQCGDIGTYKIPKWLSEYTGKKFVIETSSGTEFPEDLSKYKLIIHCGGCMLNEKEMRHRIKYAAERGVPVVNYGIFIAYVHGILKRSLMPFPELLKILEKK